MVQLDYEQGYGNESECSSEQVILSGLGCRAQCCDRDHGRAETEDMAAPECEREVRKRRERRDSGCSHERKERRPHSEERTPPPPPPPPPLHDSNRLESERRAERLSRARRPQHGVKRRRPPPRVAKQPKENERMTYTEDAISNSSTHYEYLVSNKPQLYIGPETLDVGGIQHHSSDNYEDGQDQVTRVAAVERVRRDERSVAPLSMRRDQPCPDNRLDKISKKIAVLKKNISKYENEYESQHGQPITTGDRMTDVQLTRMYENLRRLQTEKRCIKTDPVEYALKVKAAKLQKERDEKLDEALKSDKPMADLVLDIEEWLDGCRQMAGRAGIPEGNWSSSQLSAEKSCVQRALLRLEAARGRPPAHSADRGAARHLYERYRAVKRALAACRPDSAIAGNGELATIHEHEAMLFNTSVDNSSDSQEKPSEGETSEDTTETPLQSPPNRDSEEVPSSTSSAKSGTTSEEAAPSNEGLHCLGLEDLAQALTDAKIQKGILRRSIKEYEVNFELKNCRKLQRDDKKGREEDYLRYKSIKARIKLLNALINKQKTLDI